MSPRSRPHTNQPTRFPRVSGDEPIFTGVAANWSTFSPRERG